MRSIWQLIATLVVVALIMRVFVWIVLAACVGIAIWAVRGLVADGAAHRADRAALIARCDQQHRWVMAGDPRGTYGPSYREGPEHASAP